MVKIVNEQLLEEESKRVLSAIENKQRKAMLENLKDRLQEYKQYLDNITSNLRKLIELQKNKLELANNDQAT